MVLNMKLSRMIVLSVVLLSCIPRLISSQGMPMLTPAPTAVLFPGGEVIFSCNTTEDTVLWKINGNIHVGTALPAGTNLFNLTTVVVNMTMNDSTYACGFPMGSDINLSNVVNIYLADMPNKVPNVTVDRDSIILDDDNVTLTLIWREPFNNFDPIINYTVSCSGNAECPDSFTTMDNMTRSYTITNLTSLMNYTFSVVATNSIGSGPAGMGNFTAPSLPENVTGVVLMCQVMGTENKCMVEWDPITIGNGPLEQPLVYQVYYNGKMMNVTSPVTELTFTAPSLPDGVFVDNITVIVTAINRFGNGTSSEPEEFEIMASSVTNIQVTVINPDTPNPVYSITITCTIHDDSEADTCKVMATRNINGQTPISGSAQINNNRMATVTLNVTCGQVYNITAGGTLNDEVIGPAILYELNADNRPCPPDLTTTIEATPSMTETTMPSMTTTPNVRPPGAQSDDDDDNTGAIVGGVVGGICGAILLIVLIILLWFCCIKKKRGEKSSRATSPGGEKGGTGVKVHTLDRYGKPIPLEGENTDTGVELTGYTAKSPEFTVSQVPSTAPATTFQGNDYQTDEKNRVASTYGPEGSYDTLAPAEEPTAPSAEVVPPSQNGQSNPNAPKLNYADLEQFTRKPASVKKPEPQPASQYAVIDPKSLQQGTYT